MSLSSHVAHGTFEMSARTKNATLSDVFVIVTDVVPCPEVAGAWTLVLGSVRRAVRPAYCFMVACGFPCVAAQSPTSALVDRQYTFRSTTFPCWLSTSSTK